MTLTFRSSWHLRRLPIGVDTQDDLDAIQQLLTDGE